MPIFFIISGWLFKYKKYISFNIFDMLKKYRNRIIIPWLLAIFIYNIIFIALLNESFQFIYYHLWFIPSYLFCVFSVWILSKIRLNLTVILLTSIIIFLLSQYINIDSKIYNLFNYYIRPYYLLYFVFGILMRNINIKQSPLYLYSTIIMFILYTISFYITIPISRFLIGLPLCLFISLYIFSNINKSLKLPFFKWLGIKSMGVYLWHMLPIILSQHLYGNNTYLYYLSVVLFLVLFFILYKYLYRHCLFRKYFFGLQ